MARRLLPPGTTVYATIQGGSDLIIAVDFSHEPWRTLSLKLVRLLESELEEMDLALENVEQIIDIIDLQPKEIQ